MLLEKTVTPENTREQQMTLENIAAFFKTAFPAFTWLWEANLDAGDVTYFAVYFDGLRVCGSSRKLY